MSGEFEETKILGDVTCPKCKTIITIKKKKTYNQELPRKTTSEELYAEKSIQKTLDDREEE